MQDYIVTEAEKSKKKLKQYTIHGKPFMFAQPFERDIDLNYVKRKVETLNTEIHWNTIDGVVQGNLKFHYGEKLK